MLDTCTPVSGNVVEVTGTPTAGDPDASDLRAARHPRPGPLVLAGRAPQPVRPRRGAQGDGDVRLGGRPGAALGARGARRAAAPQPRAHPAADRHEQPRADDPRDGAGVPRGVSPRALRHPRTQQRRALAHRAPRAGRPRARPARRPLRHRLQRRRSCRRRRSGSPSSRRAPASASTSAASPAAARRAGRSAPRRSSSATSPSAPTCPGRRARRTPTSTTSTSRRRSSTSSGTPPATPATRRWAATTRRWSSAWPTASGGARRRTGAIAAARPAPARSARMAVVHLDQQVVVERLATVRPMEPSLPPGPREPAALQTLEWLGRPTALLRRCAGRYGEAFTLRLSFDDAPLVLVWHPDAVRAVYSADPAVARRSGSPGPLGPVAGPALDPVQRRRRAPAHPPAHARRLRPRADGRLPRHRPRRGRARGGALAAGAAGRAARRAAGADARDRAADGVRHGRPAPGRRRARHAGARRARCRGWPRCR